MPEPFSEQNVLHSWELQFCQRIVPLLAALGVQRLHANKMGRIDRHRRAASHVGARLA